MLNALVIENDQKRSSSYCSFLSKQGFKTSTAYTATEAVSFVEAERVDLILCDTQLPGIDGVVAIELIRALNPNVPVIMLSELGSFRVKQRAFLAGCDDFMVEPVDLNELALRVTALLRRSKVTSKQQVVIGDAVLDSNSFTVTEGSTATSLPPKEFMLLFKLCASPDRIFTRRDIMDDVWGIHTESGERTVDVHVKRLRKRFENSNSFRIETVRGVGYRASEISE